MTAAVMHSVQRGSCYALQVAALREVRPAAAVLPGGPMALAIADSAGALTTRAAIGAGAAAMPGNPAAGLYSQEGVAGARHVAAVTGHPRAIDHRHALRVARLLSGACLCSRHRATCRHAAAAFRRSAASPRPAARRAAAYPCSSAATPTPMGAAAARLDASAAADGPLEHSDERRCSTQHSARAQCSARHRWSSAPQSALCAVLAAVKSHRTRCDAVRGRRCAQRCALRSAAHRYHARVCLDRPVVRARAAAAGARTARVLGALLLRRVALLPRAQAVR